MSIETRDLKPGTKLVARYKGQEHSAEVVETEAGIRYRLADGREFKSPSAAGSAVMGGKACNGWRFWSLADGEAAEPKAPTKKGRKGKADPNGLLSPLADGRFFCSACQDSFDVPAGVEPQGCPNGHRLEDFQQG